MQVTVRRYTTVGMERGRPVKKAVPVLAQEITFKPGDRIVIYLGGEPALEIEADVS